MRIMRSTLSWLKWGEIEPTRTSIISMAVLVGFSVSEAMRSAPGLIFDMVE